MRINIAELLRRLIILAILLTPLLSIGEITALFSGEIKSQTEVFTPIYIKLVKDVALFLIFCLCCIVIFLRRSVSVFGLLGLVLAGYTIICFMLSFQNNPITAISGLRWALPIIMIFVLTVESDESLIMSINKAVTILFFLHVSMQFYQLSAMSEWFGKNAFGLPGRVPGIFFIPNTAAFFSIVTLFLMYFYDKRLYISVMLITRN